MRKSMEKETEKAINEQVKTFKTQWNTSVDLRFDAAKIFYKCIKEHKNDSEEVRNRFYLAFPKWSADRWKWLYMIGSGKVRKPFADVHNYALGELVANIALTEQDQIINKGLTVYSTEHPGGVMIPLNKINCPILEHAFDKMNGWKRRPVAEQRKMSLTRKSDKGDVSYLVGSNNELYAKVNRSTIFDKDKLVSVLTFVDTDGRSLLTAQDLYHVIHVLEHKK